METTLGEYITREYGLLKQVLSYLQPCDLRNTKQVCRAWRSAVDSLLDKNPKWMIGRIQQLNKEPLPKILPAVILQHSTSHLYPNTCKICKQTSHLCPQNISDDNTLFISIDSGCNFKIPDSKKESKYMFWKTLSVFMFPTSDKIQISTFSTENKSPLFKQPVTDEVVRLVTGGESPIKCLLILSRASYKAPKVRWINQIVSSLINKQGPTFAMGGGDILSLHTFKGLNKDKNPGLILITFRGDNVTAHSDLLSGFNKQKIEDFMLEMGRRVGPLPESSSRMAFLAQCVDRVQDVEKTESSAFVNVFPSIPQFGFRAYGEYGMRSQPFGTTKKDSSKKMKLSFDHAHTTSIVILTFKEV